MKNPAHHVSRTFGSILLTSNLMAVSSLVCSALLFFVFPSPVHFASLLLFQVFCGKFIKSQLSPDTVSPTILGTGTLQTPSLFTLGFFLLGSSWWLRVPCKYYCGHGSPLLAVPEFSVKTLRETALSQLSLKTSSEQLSFLASEFLAHRLVTAFSQLYPFLRGTSSC